MGIVAGNFGAILSNGAGEYLSGIPSYLEFMTEGWFTLSGPTSISPLNHATGVDSPITFVWDTGAVPPGTDWISRIQISKNSDFSTIDYEQSGITTESLTLALINYDTTYYWRVRTFEDGMTSPWSEEWDFTTNSKYGTSINTDMPIIYFRGRK